MNIIIINSTARIVPFSIVRRPVITSSSSSSSCPGIGRRIGDSPDIKPLVPIRYTTANNNSNSSTISANNLKLNLITKLDIDIQKENKFKQNLEQSNVDLSINSN